MVKHIYKTGTPHAQIEHYDLLILGAGPAGLTAALYAGRYNLKTAVIASSIGGKTKLAGEIENWPGFMGSGRELSEKFLFQAKKFGARFLETEVDDVKKDENGFVLYIKNKEIHGKALIIAFGAGHNQLGIEGEKEFIGRGVSYCSTCDGMFFKDKIVAVIGGGDSAVKSALYLSEIAKKVYIIYKRGKLRAEQTFLNRLDKAKNIEVYYECVPVKILGNSVLNELTIEETTGKETKLKLDGVFIEIGIVPANEIIEDLKIKTTKQGYIITDKQAKTNVKGVFAAGDSTNNHLKQVITASAEGAIAAKSAYDFLKD